MPELQLGGKVVATQTANNDPVISNTAIKLKSSGNSIVASDGTTGILSESGSIVTLNNVDTATIGSNALVVDASGNVGIGSTSPSSLFSIGETSGTPTFTIGRTGTNPVITAGGTNTDLQIAAVGTGGELNLTTQGTTKINVDANGNMNFYINGTSRAFNVENSSGPWFRSEAVRDRLTANGANVFCNTTYGYLYRSTSSAKYKTNIEDLEDSYADKLLELRPVWFRSNSETVDRLDWSHYGLIAEEVAEIDPRLVSFRTGESELVLDEETGKYNEVKTDLETPVPEGVFYDRLIPHIINILKRMNTRIPMLVESIKEQQALIESQQSQIDALTARIESLEATP